ncbi:MAG: beta-ketoacyl-[acyl-carrier-protein] synthase family protein [Candidatus Firestonebacteria bacterium]|nr:beta-ketoacyl-[acyl-carrier-protein] synthase family protein [Candidatus Firestonebacteria bacterium]
MSSVPVAVTGLGCICAAGNNLNECLDSMFRGTRAPRPPERFFSNHPIRYPVFEVRDFSEPRHLLRTAAFGLRAAAEALSDAGLEREQLAAFKVGVCMGTTVGCAVSEETVCRAYRSGKLPDMEPMERIFRSNPASVIAREYGFAGPCQTIVNACSSGTDAVGLGAAWIRAGLCDVVLAGGADELGRITYIGFIALQIADETPCKPFDRGRKGLNLGEGAAMLVLESESVRRLRNKKARSFLTGYGSAGDAYHLTAPKPDGAGLKAALAETLAGNGTVAESIAFVNAHGTGTPDNDRVESRVLAEVLPGVPFFSTKGYTGHTLGAAGAIEAVFTAACLELGKIPANAGFVDPDPELGAAPVAQATRITGTSALSETLAFGGNNSVVMFSRGEV